MTASSESPIFIFASAQRCGSTLLQRLLNSCPDILIWGEQGGYLNGFVREYQTLLEWEGLFPNHLEGFLHEGYDQFVACMIPTRNVLETVAASHVLALFGTTARHYGKPMWGFKETRCDAQIAFFLQKCFPEARFIHLTRNIVDCFISLKHWENSPDPNPLLSWNRTLTEKSIADWKRINASFLHADEILKQYLQIRYEDMVRDPKGFVAILSQFLKMRAEDFNMLVFNKKLYEDDISGDVDLRPKLLPSDLNAEERALLLQYDLVELAELYGYKIQF